MSTELPQALEGNGKDKPEEEITKVRSANHIFLYCNSARVARTPSDIQMSLGEVHEGENNKAVIEERLTVIMSPQHAKRFLAAINKTVTQYENEFGKIAVDPISEQK
jgi:hypothetical protein